MHATENTRITFKSLFFSDAFCEPICDISFCLICVVYSYLYFYSVREILQPQPLCTLLQNRLAGSETVPVCSLYQQQWRLQNPILPVPVFQTFLYLTFNSCIKTNSSYTFYYQHIHLTHSHSYSFSDTRSTCNHSQM